MDTNVFVALFAGDDEGVWAAQRSLEEAYMEGPLAVSPAVYAELVAGRSREEVERFFSEKGIEVDWELSREVWCTAGSRYGEYARDRRQQKGDHGPRRILADFLIGAHALHLAEELLTSDSRIYNTYFPELRVVSPGEAS